MDHQQFSYIAHQNLKICGPIGDQKLNYLIGLLRLDSNSRAVDFGAGKGEFAIRLIERFGLKADAVDISDKFLADADMLATDRIDRKKLQLVVEEADTFFATIKNKYDLGVCIGSTHAFGDYLKSLEALKKTVRPGGYIIIGEGYWKSPPAKDFLNFLGSTEEELGSHHSNISSGERLGLIPLWATVANQDEWDQYEWNYSMAIENYVTDNADAPEVAAYLSKIRNWRNATLKWGRDTFGFGLYLFRNGNSM